MPISPVTAINRQVKRRDKYNILTFCTHERYETQLAKTGHNFYAYGAEGIKTWNENYGPRPDNYHLLDSRHGANQIPLYLDLDFVLSQNKFGQFQIALQVARQLHLPIVSLEHTLPATWWSDQQLEMCRLMRGHHNVFISEFSLGEWGWEPEDDTSVVHHSVDTDTFCLPTSPDRKPYALSVVNDWINRDWCCGYRLWQDILSNLENGWDKVRVVGDTPGLSKPARSIPELVKEYQTAQVFLNTSLISPVPTALLEAMACGCAVVSTATCMIPEIIEHGHNGFLSNNPQELSDYAQHLLDSPEEASKMGRMAALTIKEKFSEPRFIKEWNSVFDKAAQIPFLGEKQCLYML